MCGSRSHPRIPRIYSWEYVKPQREYIYMWESGYYDEGFYGKGDFDSVKDWSRRKWSRIRKINHRNKRK